MTLRRATGQDVAFLAAVQEEASRAGFQHIFPPDVHAFPVDAVRERWEQFTADGGWVVRADDGFVAVREEWLEALYVLPTAWGTGRADELHDAAVAELRRRGVERARLWVLEENERARRFYERHGWQTDGTTRVVEFPPHPRDVGYALALT